MYYCCALKQSDEFSGVLTVTSPRDTLSSQAMELNEFVTHLYAERHRILRELQDPNLDAAQPAWSGCLAEGEAQIVIDRLRKEDEYAFSAAHWKSRGSALYLNLININAHMIIMLLSPHEI